MMVKLASMRMFAEVQEASGVIAGDGGDAATFI